MLTRSTGNTGGLFEDEAAMQASGSPNDRRLELWDGTIYQTAAAQGTDGLLLASGNYANPVESPQEIINGFNDDKRNDKTGSSYTIQATDRGKSVSMNNADANVITIELNVNQACVVDMVSLLRQKGLGVTTITAVTGVILNGIDGGSVDLDGQWKSAAINQYATDAWWIEGMSGEVT